MFHSQGLGQVELYKASINVDGVHLLVRGGGGYTAPTLKGIAKAMELTDVHV